MLPGKPVASDSSAEAEQGYSKTSLAAAEREKDAASPPAPNAELIARSWTLVAEKDSTAEHAVRRTAIKSLSER